MSSMYRFEHTAKGPAVLIKTSSPAAETTHSLFSFFSARMMTNNQVF